MYYEIRLKVLLKDSYHYLAICERIGAWISFASLKNETLKQAHYDKKYKHFTFGSPFPREDDEIYKKGRIYGFSIRSSLKNTLNQIRESLKRLQEDAYIQLINISPVMDKDTGFITELTTLTPAIVAIDSKPWLPGLNNVEELLQRVHANAEMKYNHLNPDQVVRTDQPFASAIQIINRNPIALHYKGRKLLGNKMRLLIREDEHAQKLAQVVMGSGLAEKNSILGAGFCIAKTL